MSSSSFLSLSLLKESDWERGMSLKKKVDGFECSSLFFYEPNSNFLKKWALLKKTHLLGVNLHPKLFETLCLSPSEWTNEKMESLYFQWKEIFEAFQFDWISTSKEMFVRSLFSPTLEGHPLPLLCLGVNGFKVEWKDPFFEETTTSDRVFKVSGAHETRWVRRYGESQIKETFSSMRKSIFCQLSYSGRFEEIDLFKKYIIN